MFQKGALRKTQNREVSRSQYNFTGEVQTVKNIPFKVSFVILVPLFILAFSGGCRKNEEKEPEPSETREYLGTKLSSVTDFRENSIEGPQYIDKDSSRLEITGLVKEARTHTYDEVIGRQSHKKVVTLNCVEGWSVTILWEGVLVRDLVEEAGVDPKAKIAILYAHDGYSTSFPLDYIMENDIIMAYKMNDLTLPPERGFPFQLVAEKKWGYKWIKWITGIELSDDEDYRGYWESRGYSNQADLDKGFFEEP
jgi:DMSO/TMAO reductase YedYZ molybdopterin-dependent catalytic subunit